MGTDLELDSRRREIQFLTDRYDPREAIIQRLRDDDEGEANSSSETIQNESGKERRRRSVSETQNYLGDTTTAPVTRDVNTPPTRATDSSSKTETEGVEEVKDSESSANEAVHTERAADDPPEQSDGHCEEIEISPPSPFADEGPATENQTLVPETPQSQLGPKAAPDNTVKKQTKKKYSPIKFPGNSPNKTLVVAKPLVQKGTVGDRLGPLPPRRSVHERIEMRSSHCQNTPRSTSRQTTRRNLLREGSLDPWLSGQAPHPQGRAHQSSSGTPFGRTTPLAWR